MRFVSRKAVLKERLDIEEEVYITYLSLFMGTRSYHFPSVFGQTWISDEGELPCPGCGIALSGFLSAEDGSRGILVEPTCLECGKCWRGSRRRSSEPWYAFMFKQRENAWSTLTNEWTDRPVKITEAWVASHLLWGATNDGEPLGHDFRILGTRTQDAENLPSDLRRPGTDVLILDLDFKKLWSEEERQEYEHRVLTDYANLDIRDVLDDYDGLHEVFCAEVRRILAVLPGHPVVIRSSKSHGVHVYVWLDQSYPTKEVTARAWGLLADRGLIESPVLDAVHPQPSGTIRLPLGYGSRLLDSKTLLPKFAELPARDQLRETLLLLHSWRARIPRVSLDSLGARRVFHRGEAKGTGRKFDPTPLLRIYREGIQSFGTRRRRTRAVVRLGRDLGFYGEELQAFVDRWLVERHNGCSYDINQAQRNGDDDLAAIRKENAAFVTAGLGRERDHVVSKRLAPIPLGWTRSIVDRFPSFSGNDLYRTVQFAYDAYALAEHLAWLNRSARKELAVSRSLWRRLHRDYHRLRDLCLDVGLIVHSGAPVIGYPSKPGTPALWFFPLLTKDVQAGDAERIPLHEALDRLGVTSRLTVHLSKKVRRLARVEKATPRWGSGLLAKQAVARKLKGLRGTEGRAETDSATPGSVQGEVLLLTRQ